jgi:hypothetical protein
MKKNRILKSVAMAGLALVALSCGSDITKNASPVELVVTNTQVLQKIDLAGGTNCDQDVGTIEMQALIKNANATGDARFNDVRITRYRVSYVRTDGGRLVPAPFVRSIDTLVEAGSGSTSLSKFVIVQGDAITQAPFVSLLPTNGGRDPDTGRTRVSMDVVIEVFGQTLAGENVSGRTRFPLDFCYNCSGCS